MMGFNVACSHQLVVGHVSGTRGLGRMCSERRVDTASQTANLLHNHRFLQTIKSSTLCDRKKGRHEISVAASASLQQQGETKAVLFDMDGVLCNSEVVSRKAGAETMKVLYNIDVSPEEFIPYTGTGEANFLGGVARKFQVENFDVDSCKEMFFNIYLSKYAIPGSGIGYDGARDLVEACRNAGLKTAVASSADLVKVHANLSAADIPLDIFDAIVSADAFENLKPSPDIFLAAAGKLGIPPANCVVIEDAVAGVQAARAADMRCIGVTTTLSEDDMITSAPDKIVANIKAISLETILTLQDTRDDNSMNIVEADQDYFEGSLDNMFSNETLLLPKILATTFGVASILHIGQFRERGFGSITTYVETIIPWSMQVGLIIFISIALPYWKNSLFKYSSAQSLKRLVSQHILYTKLDQFSWINSSPSCLNDIEREDGIILLKFWTSGCINCANTQRRIQKIQDLYKFTPLTIIGIHSAKFPQENDVSLVKSSIEKLNVKYPVVLDSENNDLFRQFGVTGWPTFIAMKQIPMESHKGEARARILSTFVGEKSVNDLEEFLEKSFGSQNLQVKTTERANPEEARTDIDAGYCDGDAMKSPSYVDFDPLTRQVFVTDTGNNLILVFDSEGNCIHRIGGTKPGYKDGSSPMFRSPRGIKYHPEVDSVFVCDTGNHCVRKIDMKDQIVSTLCGDGNQGFDLIGGKAGILQRLNAPYGIVIGPGGNNILVSMAGSHQIWYIDIYTKIGFSFSGIGKELNRNGGLRRNGLTVAYSQPEGITMIPSTNMLVVADSESSSIRLVDIKTGGSISLVGGDPWFEGNLFLFGDRDGSGFAQRIPFIRPLMQHPSDVAINPRDPNKIFISDTYNDKIKLYDLRKNELCTISEAFETPEGICFMDDHHLLVVENRTSSLKLLNVDNQSISSLPLALEQTYCEEDICRAD